MKDIKMILAILLATYLIAVAVKEVSAEEIQVLPKGALLCDEAEQVRQSVNTRKVQPGCHLTKTTTPVKLNPLISAEHDGNIYTLIEASVLIHINPEEWVQQYTFAVSKKPRAAKAPPSTEVDL